MKVLHYSNAIIVESLIRDLEFCMCTNITISLFNNA
jgi:hypothetical protein